MSQRYRKAEKILYTYPALLMRWQEAIDEYIKLRDRTDYRAQRYSELTKSEGEASDPPAEYVNEVLTMEARLREYESTAGKISSLRKRLSLGDEREREMHLILECVYFEQLAMSELAHHLGKSERTLYRRREELVRIVIEELGL